MFPALSFGHKILLLSLRWLLNISKVSLWLSMCSRAVLCFLCYINLSRSFVLNCQARQLWYVSYVSNIFQINVFHLIWAFLWMSHSTLLLCVVCVWFLCRSLAQLCPHVTLTVALLANWYTWWFALLWLASKTPKFSCFSFFLFFTSHLKQALSEVVKIRLVVCLTR